MEGVREQRPALRLLEQLDLCVGRAGRGGLDAVGTEVAMASYDVYDVCMVRKQLYISDEHERALKGVRREAGWGILAHEVGRVDNRLTLDALHVV